MSRRHFSVVVFLMGCGSTPAAIEPAVSTPDGPSETAPASSFWLAPRLLSEAELTSLGPGSFQTPAGLEVALPRAEGVHAARVTFPGSDFVIGIFVLPWPETGEEDQGGEIHRLIAEQLGVPLSQSVRFARNELPLNRGWDLRESYDFSSGVEEGSFGIALRQCEAEHCALLIATGPIAITGQRSSDLGVIQSTIALPGMGESDWSSSMRQDPVGQVAENLRTFIGQGMEQLDVQSLSIGIVIRPDEGPSRAVFLEGFGHEVVGLPAPQVSPRTRFMIGSVTKPLTSLMMARLVDRGLLRWDSPVVDLLPQFAVADQDITRRCELRHTVCACTGMPRRDFEMLFVGDRRDEAGWLTFLSTLAPTTGFGQTFQYSNLMVDAGGWAAAHARYPRLSHRAAFSRVMQEEVFTPLGMRDTTLDDLQAERGDHAVPMLVGLDGTARVMPVSEERWVRTMGPAGAAWSTAADMSRYISMELDRGRVGHRQYLSEEQLMNRRAPQVSTGDRSYYGLALGHHYKHGLSRFEHGGGTMGFATLMSFYPDLGLGFIIVNNGAQHTLNELIELRALELMLGITEDVEAERNLAEVVRITNERRDEMMSRIESIPDVARWVGTFSNPELGDINFALEGEHLYFSAGPDHRLRSRIGYRSGDHGGELVFLDPPLAGMPFQIQPDGTLVLADVQVRYVFARGE